MFSSLFSVFSTLLVVIPLFVNAAPHNARSTSPVEYLAFAPSIITPTAGDVWPLGSNQTVSWRTDNVPDAAKNYTVVILLGYNQNNSENLDTKNPLAAQIPVMAGSVQVTIPLGIPPRNDYIIVVIGDSGNASPPFTIQ